MELYNKTATQILHSLKKKEISAAAVTKYYLERIEKYNPSLNCITCVNPKAMEEAERLDERGPEGFPLFGLTVLVKDNIDIQGLPTTAGSKALEDNTAKKDAEVIRRLREVGVIVLGKTNMTEFANYTTQGMPGGYSSYGGQVINAYDPEHTPSGSSSGSAVAMSAGLCSAALGTDTSFSVVACATDNGVVGVKPAHGEVSGDGILPLAATMDSVGMLTRTLKDAILFLEVMRKSPLGEDTEKDKQCMKLAMNMFQKEFVSKEQMKRYRLFFKKVKKKQKISIKKISQPYYPEMAELMKREFMSGVEEYLQENGNAKSLADIVKVYEENPDSMMKYGITLLKGALEAGNEADNAEKIEELLKKRELVKEQVEKELAAFDACLMTGPTSIMHFTGLPSLSFPFTVNEKEMPVSMILYGADERKLYRAARVLESFADEIPLPL